MSREGARTGDAVHEPHQTSGGNPDAKHCTGLFSLLMLQAGFIS